jgi:predicted nucleotidyltransferase
MVEDGRGRHDDPVLPTGMTGEPHDRAVKSLLEGRVPELIALYRFGSSVEGGARPDSDLDYALLARDRLDPVQRFEIQEDLACRLHRPVDLVDLRSASTVLRAQVISRGVALVIRDPAAVERFEIAAYASYARLNEERREILAQIAREGTVYGR